MNALIIGDAPPNADQVAFALSFRDNLLRGLDRHSSDCREELPLIGMRIEVGVDEHAVARLARRKLQGECNQVPEPSLRQCVLVWEKAIVGIETELVPALHGSCEQYASEFARGNCRQRAIEEDPNVATFPGTGALQGSGHVQLLAGL